MTAHLPVLPTLAGPAGLGVRTLLHRRARVVSARARADAVFGEWPNPSIRPRADQRRLAAR